MKLTNNQFEQFKEAAAPLKRFLQIHCHPHCTVIVNSEQAELVEGIAMSGSKVVEADKRRTDDTCKG